MIRITTTPPALRLALCGIALLLVGCPGEHKASKTGEHADHDDHDHEKKAAAYQCPMKCEGEKTYPKPGKCPKCGMALKKLGDGGHQGADHMKHMAEVRAWLKKELGDKYDAKVPPATEAQLSLGKQVYQESCASCHGAGGKGDGAAAAGLTKKPADFTDAAHAYYYSDAGRLHIIRKGVKGTPMVAWEASLEQKEIEAVFQHVRSLRPKRRVKDEHKGHDKTQGDDGHGDHDH